MAPGTTAAAPVVKPPASCTSGLATDPPPDPLEPLFPRFGLSSLAFAAFGSFAAFGAAARFSEIRIMPETPPQAPTPFIPFCAKPLLLAERARNPTARPYGAAAE